MRNLFIFICCLCLFGCKNIMLDKEILFESDTVDDNNAHLVCQNEYPAGYKQKIEDKVFVPGETLIAGIFEGSECEVEYSFEDQKYKHPFTINSDKRQMVQVEVE